MYSVKQIKPLIATSAIIGPVHPDYMPSLDQEKTNMPVYIDSSLANDDNNNDDDDKVDDDGCAAEGNNND